MLAAVKETPGAGISLKEVAVPTPGRGECLVRVRAAGICGTDMPIIGGEREVPLPLIPGHEFSGEVVELGPPGEESSCPGVGVGDRVTAALVVFCGACHVCRSGYTSLCQEGERLGINRDGFFAQYAAVPIRNLVPLPEGMTHIQGAMADPAACALRPLLKALRLSGTPEEPVKPENWPETFRNVFVLGPGPIGLFALQLALALGAPRAAVVGTRSDRLALAKKLGAGEVINLFKEDLEARADAITGGRGADLVVEATGNPEAVGQALTIVSPGGTVVLAGIFKDRVRLDALNIVRKEPVVTGSLCYTLEEMRVALDLLASGDVRVDEIVTHRMPLREMESALGLLRKRKAVKVILDPWT